jgi:hypothetical protein
MSRPCRWPDGGCGEQIIDVVTVKGAKQVLDAAPQKRIVLELPDDWEGFGPEPAKVARVVDTYVDHHATCTAWAAKVERERAAKAARP